MSSPSRHNFQLTPPPAVAIGAASERRNVAFGLWELTKPRLSFLSVVTALVGYLSAQPLRDFWLLVHFLCGTALSAGGAAALNQWMERRTDAIMRRTQNRPIPSGQISSPHAFIFGVALAVIGVLQLLLGVNALAAVFSAATIGSYIFLYTPLKRRTRWSTEVGAVAGALPPLIGWAAARGTVDGLGWWLFAILFFWQIPHFLAIAWIYRRDYAAVHFPMLPVVDTSGWFTGVWTLINTIALVVASVLPVFQGYCSWFYGAAALALGAAFIALAVRMLRGRSHDTAARQVFLYSVLYLPALLAVLVIDRWLF